MSSDPYSKATTLLLHGIGSDGSTTILDSSPMRQDIKATGEARIRTAQSKFGGSSLYFSGAESTNLWIPNRGVYQFGTSDFTVEWWMYCEVAWTSMTNPGIVGQKNSAANSAGWQIYRNSEVDPTRLSLRCPGTSDYSSGATPATQQWQHWAICRKAGTLRFFADGVQTASYAHSGVIVDTSGLLFVGKTETWGGYFKGYLQDIRITSWAGRYSADFSPPTALLPDPDRMTPIIADPARLARLDGGAFRIANTVSRLGLRGRYRVRLYDRRSGRCVRETWSGTDGVYVFEHLAYRPQGYFVVGFDHTGDPVNASVKDLLTPEPMP